MWETFLNVILLLLPIGAPLGLLFHCKNAYDSGRPMVLRIIITAVVCILCIVFFVYLFSGVHWCEGCQDFH